MDKLEVYKAAMKIYEIYVAKMGSNGHSSNLCEQAVSSALMIKEQIENRYPEETNDKS